MEIQGNTGGIKKETLFTENANSSFFLKDPVKHLITAENNPPNQMTHSGKMPLDPQSPAQSKNLCLTSTDIKEMTLDGFFSF